MAAPVRPPYQYDPREQERKRKEEAQAKKDKKKEEKRKAKEETDLGITGDANIDVSTDPLTGRTYLTNKDGSPVWLLPDPRDPSKYTYSTDYDASRKSVQQQFITKDGDLEGLRTILYSKGYITQEQYKQKDNAALNKALFEASSQYGIDQRDAVANGLQPGYMSFADYLSGLAGSVKGGPTTTTSRRITTRGDADEEVNTLFYNYLGRRASKKEREEYYKELNKAERSAAVRRTSSEAGAVETGELIDENDRFFIFGKIAAPAAKGTEVESLLKGGGRVAQDIMDLKEYAAQNGYRMSDEEARGMVNQTLTKRGITMETLKTKIRGVSRTVYSNLQLDDDIDVGDLGKQFARQKEEFLELAPGSVSIFDKDVQAALRNNGNKGVMDMGSYRIALKNNPAWPKTQNAREEAAKFASTILESFGLA